MNPTIMLRRINFQRGNVNFVTKSTPFNLNVESRFKLNKEEIPEVGEELLLFHKVVAEHFITKYYGADG